MRAVLESPSIVSTEINRNKFQRAQELAPTPFGRACRGMWGADAAIELAARSHSSVRIAEYKIAGRVKPNGVDVAVIVLEITGAR